MKVDPGSGGATAPVTHHKIIDVSNNQGRINFTKVKAAGIFGVYAKVTEGASYLDPYFERNRKAAHSAGLKFGVYHFARPDHNDPSDEVHNLIQHAGHDFTGQLRPALDLEVAGHKFHPNAVSWARDFSQRFHSATGIFPLFYSYPAFIASLGASRPIGGGLWLASYGPNDGNRHEYKVPEPWEHVKLHQFTSQGVVPGVSGHVDVSYAADPATLIVRAA